MGQYDLEKLIMARYGNSVINPKKKNITFNMDEEMLERLDVVVNKFNAKEVSTTRNSIIEEALLAYIDKAEDFFYDLENEEDNLKTSSTNYDLAVFPAINNNFNNIFLINHEWTGIRIAEHRIKNIKYIALYRGKPVSAITHYAEVLSISKADSQNKRVIKINDPIMLKKPIPLGNIPINNVRKLFYTSLENLLKAKEIKEII